MGLKQKKIRQAVTPSRLALWLLKRVAREKDYDFAEGDLVEAFTQIALTKGTKSARHWFWKEVLRALPGFLKNSFNWKIILFMNYLKTGIRNMAKNKVSSFINISGFAVGMACSLLIFLWVSNQLSMDKSQEFRDRIHRLEQDDWVEMPTVFKQLVAGLPEIQEVTRFYTYPSPSLKYGEVLFNMKDFVFADSCVFDVFTFEFLKGDAKTALDSPFSVVLTQSFAQRFFGNKEPVGKIIKYDNEFNFTVTGIIQDPQDFHIEIDALASFQSLPEITGQADFLEKRNKWNFLTYLLVVENTDRVNLEKKVNEAIKKDYSEDTSVYILRPFKDIYFSSNLIHEAGVKHGNLQLVILFSVIALAILLIACFNFINLITARSARRAKEISVRKILGAHRKNLFMQFSSETLITVFSAGILTVLLVALFLPVFNRMIGGTLIISLSDPRWIVGTVLIFLFTGIAAGTFPSLYLSSLDPLILLKGKTHGSVKKAPFRRGLIVIQFSVAIFLIIGTTTVLRQIDFMKHKDLGFSKDQIIMLDLKGELLGRKKWQFKNILLQNPDILAVSFASGVPGNITNTHTWSVRGQEKSMIIIETDPDYIDLMRLELIEGRQLSWVNRTDFARKVIINEEAVKYLGMEPAVGELVQANFGASEIIGVVKNYHFNSLHKKIAPLAICWYDPWATMSNIKISGRDMGGTISYLQDVWNQTAPGFPFAYSFMDESFEKHYQSEAQMAGIMKYFAFLAVLLANLGLFGLAAYLVEQRIKEIGIRITLGATAASIVRLISKEFFNWIVIANLIAWPMAYYLMNTWLQNYAYRINQVFWVFILSGLVALVIALLTISYQTLKAALSNPVNALRYE